MARKKKDDGLAKLRDFVSRAKTAELEVELAVANELLRQSRAENTRLRDRLILREGENTGLYAKIEKLKSVAST